MPLGDRFLNAILMAAIATPVLLVAPAFLAKTSALDAQSQAQQTLQGASTTALSAFDVASIKLHNEPAHIIDISTSGARLTAQAEMVGGLIMYAYDLKGGYQLAWSPGLSGLGDQSYDVEAEVDGSRIPTEAEFRQMLQSLLADRFKLKVHHEMRQTQVYAVLVGKDGPKFKQSAPDAKFSGFMGVNGRNENMTMTDATIDQIVHAIANFTDRPVVDKTGLSGIYDIKFEATPAFRIDNNPDPHDISISDAVTEQLGLKLRPEKDMVDVVVVDHLEPPSAN